MGSGGIRVEFVLITIAGCVCIGAFIVSVMVAVYVVPVCVVVVCAFGGMSCVVQFALYRPVFADLVFVIGLPDKFDKCGRIVLESA